MYTDDVADNSVVLALNKELELYVVNTDEQTDTQNVLVLFY